MKSIRVATCVVLLAAVGCGYKAASMAPGDVKSVAVPIFENTSFRVGLEFDLTRAVIAELQSRGDMQVASRSEADTELLGKIAQYRRPVLSKDPAGVPLEARVEVCADIVWKDLRTQKVLLQSRGVKASADYVPASGETEEDARAKAMDRLARRIAELIRQPW